MLSLNKRLDRLERIVRTKSKDRAEWHYMMLPDNGRLSSGFRVLRPFESHVIIVPTSESVWPDGTSVFASLTTPPEEVAGKLTELTESQWEELSKAEKFHQRGDSK